MNLQESGTMTADMEALKTRLKATWMAGDYGHFARYLEPGALEFLARLAISPGTRMLDLGCGAGQIAIPAARAGAQVTGIDIAANSIAQAQARAAAEGVTVRFEEADAEMLPYRDAQFDLVVSLIGAMFAPRPALVASEMLRVCRPGGRIAMANWTPDGHVGQMFKVIGAYVPPPPLMESPLKWGDEATVRARLEAGAARIDVLKRLYPMRYPFAPAEVADFFFRYYGPAVRALAVLDENGQNNLRRDLTALWSVNNRASGGATEVAAEYLEVMVRRA